MDRTPCMILCVAGQSNAVGYDESYVPADYLEQFDRTRIRQLGLYGADNRKVIPLGVCAQSDQDLRPYSDPANPQPALGTRGIHLPLAQRLLPVAPEGAHLLVLSCAYGGTGFTVGDAGRYDEAGLRPESGAWRWGSASPYYRGRKDRISYVLDQNPDSRLLGVVWIQGEHDSADSAGQIRGFNAMTADFFSFFSARYPGRVLRGDWNRDIWYNVETVSYWYGVGECARIRDHYRGWNPGTYVEIPRDTDSNAVNGAGLTASLRACHFGNDAYCRVAAHGGGDAAASVQMTALQSESGIPTGRAQKRGWSILRRCSNPFVMVPKAALSLFRDGCGRPRDLCTTARDGTCRCRDSSRIRRSRSSLPYDAFCCRRRGPRWQRTRPARSDL